MTGIDLRSEIREFLSTRRARITPEQAGLPAYGGNRRVKGLRREEVAMLAGIRSLAKGGRFVSTGYTDQSLEVHPIEFILPETIFVSTVAATRLDLQDALTLADAGALTVPVAASYPMDGIHDALDALRARSVLGRQVLELA